MTRRNALAGAKLNLCHAVLAVAVASSLSPSDAHAQTMETRSSFSIPAGDLASAVDAFSRQSGLQILYKPELLKGRRVGAISGSLANQEVLARLLKGTDVQWERVNGGTIVLKKVDLPRRDEPKGAPNDRPILPEQRASVQDLEEMVVVGSRLGTSPVESAMPIKVVTREDIDRSGAGNIAQALSYLSEIPVNNVGDKEIGDGTGLYDGNTNSTTVQMRGLPRGTTLILINGRRAGASASATSTGQFDLSTIPLGLVERIEVLPAGASAVYGADGLAGVINVVLRKDADGFEFRIRKSLAENYATEQFSAMWGAAWSKGSATVAVNWSSNDALLNQNRRLTSDQNYTRFGGEDLRTSLGAPGNVYSLAGCAGDGFCDIPLNERGNLPGLTSPFAGVPSAQDGTGLTPASFSATQGVLNNATNLQHLKSAERSYSISATGRLELTRTIEAFAELTYSRREVPAYQTPFTLFGGNYGFFEATVGANNPFNPFGVDVGVDYYYRNTGLYANYDQDSYRGVAGLTGKLGKFAWEMSTSQIRDQSGTHGASAANPELVAAALRSSDPATALNPFVGNGGAPASPELLRSLYTDLSHESESRTDVLSGFIRGPVARLPAGDITALLGAERQKQRVYVNSNAEGLLIPSIDGETKSNALFAEFRLPILSPATGSSYERLALSGAMRSESSDRFEERARTETLGMEFRPVESLLFRATYSTAFRPLLAYWAVQPSYDTLFFVSDPRNPGPRYPVQMNLFGGVPNGLGPETSDTTTFGLLYRPTANFSLSVTRWNIQFRDRIASISTQVLVDNEDDFPGRVVRDPVTGLITRIDGRQVNVARNDTSGIDLAADLYWETGVGEIHAGLAATYTSQYDQQLTDTSPTVSRLAVHSLEGWAPRWKIVPRLNWQPSEWLGAMVVGRYVSKYQDSAPLTSGPNAGRYKQLGDFWIFDLNATIELSSLLGTDSRYGQSRLSLGATNLFNRLPEFCAGCSYAGYDASQYDILGRSVYAEIRWSF